MRFLAATILTTALALPAMAQPGRGGPDRPGPGGDPKAEIERLRERLKDLESRQKQDGDKKKDEKKKDEKKKDDDKKADDKKPESKKEEGRRDEQRGPGARGPMGGFGGGPGGFGPPGFRGRDGQEGHGFGMPGLDRLSPEEQATFKKLVAKMTGRGGEAEARKPDAPKGEFKKPDAPKDGGKPNPGKPSLDERLDRLEKMVQELARNRGGNRE